MKGIKTMDSKVSLFELSGKFKDARDIDIDYVKSQIPCSYEEIKHTVKEFYKKDKLSLVEKKVLAICYQVASKLISERRLDLFDPFDKKVAIVLQREGEIGWSVYDTLLPKDILEAIHGYEYVNKKGHLIWQRRKDREKTISHLIKLINPYPKERIIDLGCGSGPFIYYCAKLGADCVGVDYSPSRVQIVQDFFSKQNFQGKAKIDLADVEDLPYPDGSFDKAVAADVIEHLTYKSKRRVLREALRILKAGGLFYLSTPNLTYLKLTTLFKRLKAILTLKNPYKEKIPFTLGASEGIPQHIGLVDLKEIFNLLEDSGFVEIKVAYRQDEKLDVVLPLISRYILKKNKFLSSIFGATLFLVARAPYKKGDEDEIN